MRCAASGFFFFQTFLIYSIEIAVILISNLHGGDCMRNAFINQLACHGKLFFAGYIVWERSSFSARTNDKKRILSGRSLGQDRQAIFFRADVHRYSTGLFAEIHLFRPLQASRGIAAHHKKSRSSDSESGERKTRDLLPDMHEVCLLICRKQLIMMADPGWIVVHQMKAEDLTHILLWLSIACCGAVRWPVHFIQGLYTYA